MKLIGIRILLLLAAAALTASIISTVTGTSFSLAITPQLSALFFIPVNVVGLWLLHQNAQANSTTLLQLMAFDRASLGRDLLMGLVWLWVLFIPFSLAISLAMLVLFGPAEMYSSFEMVFAPDSQQLLSLPVWFAWVSAVAVAILFPLTNAPVEELTYRGHAQSGLIRSGVPAWAGVLLTSLAFGVQHVFLAPTGTGMLVFGLAFAFWGAGASVIYLRTRRLMPVVAAHFYTNLMFGIFPLVFLFLGIG